MSCRTRMQVCRALRSLSIPLSCHRAMSASPPSTARTPIRPMGERWKKVFLLTLLGRDAYALAAGADMSGCEIATQAASRPALKLARTVGGDPGTDPSRRAVGLPCARFALGGWQRSVDGVFDLAVQGSGGRTPTPPWSIRLRSAKTDGRPTLTTKKTSSSPTIWRRPRAFPRAMATL